jgi:hypothetical protein
MASGSQASWADLKGLTDDEAKAKSASFLFDELRQRVKDGTVAFNFNLELAQSGDKIDSATVPLPVGVGRFCRPLPGHHLQPLAHAQGRGGVG